ncbi:GIY-YIG nuclease family protein [Lacibacter sp.]|uniref:GIY-YIG nuclease family protein n=1 Tax=Lacibacter sp. TaxID=1915409 RepID=UPI0039C91910
MPFFVYILYSMTYDRFYVGQTQDINERLKRHNNGYEDATSPYIPWELRCCIEKENRSEAMILERKLKNMNREKLWLFISKYG